MNEGKPAMLRKVRLIAASALEYLLMEVSLPIILIIAGIIMLGLLFKYPDLFSILFSLLIAFLERG
jgi:hypothetical protein